MRLGPWFVAAAALIPSAAMAQSRGVDSLHAFSDSVEELSHRVDRSVVQVFSTGYSFSEEDEQSSSTTAGLVTKERSSGSGVILSGDGYIITNNHVVQNARRVRVQLAPNDTVQDPLHTASRRRGRIFEAHVVGTDRESDLAVLKVESSAPLLPLRLADSESLKQGQVVLAVGNPLGLENSVSLGVVSSVGRQIKADDPMTYIQTDAPINPGNSGGPLLNVDGDVVGINTFIFTQSGGSEGIGFAIPSNTVQNVYEQIRKDGHVHRGEIGVTAQSITPELAAGLGLKQENGVILADVTPGGPADTAGLEPGDIIASMNGKPVESARHFQVELYRIPLNQSVDITVMRGTEEVPAKVKVIEREDDPFRFLDLVNPEANQISRLGIIGLAISRDLAKVLPPTRKPYGVIVAARSGPSEYGGQGGLKLGDVIYEVNGVPMATVDALRQAVNRLKPFDPLVIRIERDGKLMYLVLSE
ncbi:MAG: trypsin-like peptidase domain-containing protein [Acidobacteriota bacterium]|nr:trypsin-like peptidase domain-containing protein [Acidobacteriota bacterium]